MSSDSHPLGWPDDVRTLAAGRNSQGTGVLWVGVDGGVVRMPLQGPWRMVSSLGKRGNGVWSVRVERVPGDGERLWLGSDGDGVPEMVFYNGFRAGHEIRAGVQDPSAEEPFARYPGPEARALGIERLAEILTEWYLAEPNEAAESDAD